MSPQFPTDALFVNLFGLQVGAYGITAVLAATFIVVLIAFISVRRVRALAGILKKWKGQISEKRSARLSADIQNVAPAIKARLEN